MLFPPFLEDGNYFIDGGLLANYPLRYCVEKVENPDEIIGFDISHNKEDTDTDKITNSNMLKYMLYVIKKIIAKSNKQDIGIPPIQNTITYNAHENVFVSITTAISSKESRQRYLEEGFALAEQFLERFN
jgi:predicted acylesterase/phospholipase RssA